MAIQECYGVFKLHLYLMKRPLAVDSVVGSGSDLKISVVTLSKELRLWGVATYADKG